MEKLLIRALRKEDSRSAAVVFFEAVHRGAAGHYSREQRLAWAGPEPDPERWDRVFDGLEGFAAEVDGEFAGFLSLDGEGYIDFAFVHPDHAGTGVAWQIYQKIEQDARERGIGKLTTNASRVARPFFERQGWSVEREQQVERNGATLTNFRMSRLLC